MFVIPSHEAHRKTNTDGRSLILSLKRFFSAIVLITVILAPCTDGLIPRACTVSKKRYRAYGTAKEIGDAVVE